MNNKMAFVIIFMMLLLTSCTVNSDGQEPSMPQIRDYYSVDVTYSEPMEKFAFRLNMDTTETDTAKYFFETCIDEQERDACIKTTEKVLSVQTLETVVPEIYVFSQDRYNYKYISDHKLYCSIQPWESLEYITDVLLTAYGETAHYGTAFGYANFLAQGNEWCVDSEEIFNTPSDLDILDLNCLCYDENFTSSDDIRIAKEIACDFVVSVIEQHGEEVIQQLSCSHSEALNAFSSYYTDNGTSYFPSSIQYSYGGKSYDYLVCSEYGTFYITEGWVDMNAEYNPMISDGFLHADYSNTKEFFETNVQQMRQYQILFKLDEYNNDLDIVFTNPLDGSKNSFYQSSIHRIYLYNVDSLMHEYIHALTMPTTSMASWQVEGFARYFSYYYDYYGIPLLNQDYNNTPDTPTTKYVHEYLAVINRPIDMAKDYRELENVAVYYFGFTNPNENYLTGSSFVQYLVKQYGEDAVINHIYGNADPLSKSYKELVKDWNKYIDSEYQEYSKYEK